MKLTINILWTTFVVIFLVSACTPQKSTESKADSLASQNTIVATDSVTSLQAPPVLVNVPEASSTFTLRTTDYNAVLISGTTIYSDTTENSNEILDFEAPEAVKIISQTILYYPLDADLCSQNPMFEVTLSLNEKEITGWVDGNQIILAEETAGQLISEIVYQNKSYQLFIGRDAGIGASDQNGLTGCNEYQIPYLLDRENRTISFIDYGNAGVLNGDENGISPYYNWVSFISSEGVSVETTSVTVDDDGDYIYFQLSISFQEGGQQATMHVKKEGDSFKAMLVSVNDKN